MKKRTWLWGRQILSGCFILLFLAAVSSAAEWPTKTIIINCVTSVGGTIDMVVRAFVPEISNILGVPVIVVNMPGGGGGICAQNTYNAPNDGYTWQAQGGQLRVMTVLGYHDKPPKDWYCTPLAGYTCSIAVRADSPYKTFSDLVEAMKKNPGKIPLSGSYRSTSWAMSYELMKKVTGLGGLYVPYSGDPAVHVALLSGDIQFEMSTVMGQVELLKGGKIRALAHFDDKPIHIKGYGNIPAITDFLPALKPHLPFPAWASISLRADTPTNLVIN